MSSNVWEPVRCHNVKYMTKPTIYARHSFVLQPSLCCLDLNFREYSLNCKPTNNFGEYKRQNERRHILGRLHLDVPVEIEFDSKEVLLSPSMNPVRGIPYFFPLFHPGRFIVPEQVYVRRLDGVVADFIRKSSDKVGIMRRFLPPILAMKLYEEDVWVISIYQHFLPLLQKECGEGTSELVVDIMKSFGCRFLKWVLNTGSTDLEFFQLHAQRMGYDIWNVRSLEPSTGELDGPPDDPVRVPFNPVNKCCILGNLRNVRPLIKFGVGFVCSEECLEELKNYVFRCLTPKVEENDFLEKLQKNLDVATRNIQGIGLSLERSCHLFVAFELYLLKIHVVMYSKSLALNEALCCIWGTIPEPYFCRSEVMAIFEGTCTSQWPEAVVEFCSYYDKIVCGGSFTDNYNPRSLTHLSRCKAREVLKENRQLPHGIDKLNVPDKIKLYLSLDL